MGMRISTGQITVKTQWKDYVKHLNPFTLSMLCCNYCYCYYYTHQTASLPLWEFILRLYLLVFFVRWLFASKWKIVLANIKWETILLGVHILPSLNFDSNTTLENKTLLISTHPRLQLWSKYTFLFSLCMCLCVKDIKSSNFLSTYSVLNVIVNIKGNRQMSEEAIFIQSIYEPTVNII